MENEKLSKAKARLIIDNPFFASLLFSMEFIQDNSIETFATDGASIIYNESYLETLEVSEIVFILAHEVLHCVFMHFERLEEKDSENWNRATDYVINDLLCKESGVGVMPKGGLLDSALVQRGGGTAEGVYNLLPAKPKNNNSNSGQGNSGSQGNNNGQGKPLDSLKSPKSKDAAAQAQRQAEMKVKLAQAHAAAKMQGALSQGMERLVKECLKTETNWREVLRNFISKRTKTDLSYAKPKRRYLADDIYMPSLIGEKLGALVVAVDCSGSINEKQLAEFESEIKSIFNDVKPSEIKIVYFDSKVLRVETIEPDNSEEIKLKPIGGGGTAFSPIFAEISKDDILPVACVILTDLECDEFGPCPEFPVLWASTSTEKQLGNRSVPFGETIFLRGENNEK